ncbi:plasmid replication protein RepB [Pseudomonas luteola]|uniref:Plasmid replication protein RepB n=1 Tax=Pseudomonas luteola TaxID=47886 RepID=A0A2X2C5G2_PSELU|nr:MULTISPECIES: plasmid replication protein RepB [Pseudomonas]SPZ02538.1 plasmid replication protein RepB [Pseudomonas luteola]
MSRQLEKISGRICNFVHPELVFGSDKVKNSPREAKYVNLAEMRILYECGALTEATLAPAPMEPGFIMVVKRRDGKEEIMSVTKGDRHKIYKSLDAASSDAKRVGFKEVILKVA